MGCDIHLYPESRSRRVSHAMLGWRSFAGRMNPGRAYRIFEALAGVRGEESNAIVAPRGVPDDMAWDASGDYGLYVVSDDAEKARLGMQGDRAATLAKATEWVTHGASRWLDGPFPAPRYGTLGRISGPDWHTPSWLTASEFAHALQGVAHPDYHTEWLALSVALMYLESNDHDARVVFWFDN